MVYIPFEAEEALRHRRDYAEDALRQGSPVAGISMESGVLLLTVRGPQRKIFEIYDRIMFSAVGNQSDIEALRLAAIEVAHREGFERSPDDVTAARLVGFSLSPPLKRLFGDRWGALPAVVRAVLAELGARTEEDSFHILNYDGEFSRQRDVAAIAGTEEAEQAMLAELREAKRPHDLDAACRAALRAWGKGVLAARQTTSPSLDASEETGAAPLSDDQFEAFLRGEVQNGTIEAGFLDRETRRESRFRLLGEDFLGGLAGPAD